ncbi:MAG: YkgJ family cysteine cluster protein, partial [Rhodospirillaceae bacterium]|nr:YkgJ family cysteine cluster protein [Rhodospirillaceae bacterium]
ALVNQPAACGRGCHHCCRTLVTATAPEILRLARAVKARPDIAARIPAAAARARTTAATAPHTTRQFCPILDAEICSLYEARPLACRSLLSQSRDVCIRVFNQDRAEAIPFVRPSREIRDTVILMLQASLRLAALPYQQYELIQGLAAALSQDDAEGRWLAGEPVFAGVETDPDHTRAAQVSQMVERLAASLAPTL